MPAEDRTVDSRYVFVDRVAPTIACSSGARRAGQDRAAPKGSLDAPKALPNNREPERQSVASSSRPLKRAGVTR
jgi:hypothetical protein